MPLICRLAPPSPNMNIRPPMTIATSASERASGPVNVASRFEAARSHGDCARAECWERHQQRDGCEQSSDSDACISTVMCGSLDDEHVCLQFKWSHQQHARSLSRTLCCERASVQSRCRDVRAQSERGVAKRWLLIYRAILIERDFSTKPDTRGPTESLEHPSHRLRVATISIAGVRSPVQLIRRGA